MTKPRHFLDLDLVDRSDLRAMIDDGVRLKADRRRDGQSLGGRTLAIILEMPSTRTRISFELAMCELGGRVVMLDGATTQIQRGETYADTGRVLSRYVDAVAIRTSSADNLFELAQSASIPVINGLTDRSHPCQIMADVMTFEERLGSIRNRVIAWFGDGNNVVRSWIHASAQFSFELRVACPSEYAPPHDLVARAKEAGGRITLLHDPVEAARGADCLVTDAWVSMTDSQDKARGRDAIMAPYQVNEKLLSFAKKEAIIMHCLPAYRGREIAGDLLDGKRSAVWCEAENRLHVQKAILRWCFGVNGNA